MRILVTGGAGYVGSHLVEVLRQGGHAVRVLDLHPAGGDPIQGNIADPSLAAEAVQEVEVVYHLAWSFVAWEAYPRFCPEKERQEFQENLFGTLNLLEAALATGSASRVELIEDSTQWMSSVSVNKLRERLGYEPEKGEFLTELIQQALSKENEDG